MSSASQPKSSQLKTETVHIELGERSYDIAIGKGLIERIGDYLPIDIKSRKLFIVTDENVVNPHGRSVEDALNNLEPLSVETLVLPAGEKTKSFSELEKITSWLVEKGVDRNAVLFAVGGGVIGDIAGFAAAVTMRGIPYVQIPTTLLAQVDSSVGGKTAINIPKGKNLVGAFYQPIAVICDLDTLATLPERQLLAGYAEVVKYALINDPEFFIWLRSHGKDVLSLDGASLTKAIKISCLKKAEIVSADETEQGMRALLNLGHTFGHALEAAAGYDGRLLHGEAVAIGTIQAFHLSVRMGVCNQSYMDDVIEHFSDLGLPIDVSGIKPRLETTVDELVTLMHSDKKASAGKIKFIIVDGIGKARISDRIDMDDVRAVLKHSLSGHKG